MCIADVHDRRALSAPLLFQQPGTLRSRDILLLKRTRKSFLISPPRKPQTRCVRGRRVRAALRSYRPQTR